MGCAQSGVDNEESVTRCKERENLMKEAVMAQNAFAVAHSGYAMALKNTGAALIDYGHGESDQTLDHTVDHPQQPVDTAPQPPPPMPIDNLPSPPPPLPNFSPSPIKRSISMPTMPIKGPAKFGRVDSMVIEEEGEEEEENEGEKEGSRSGAPQEVENATPPRTPESIEGKHETTQPEMETPPPMPPPMPPPLMPSEEEEEEEEKGYLQLGRTIRNYNNTPEAMEPKTPEKLEEEKDKEDEDEDEKEQNDAKKKKNKGKTKIERSNTAPPEFGRSEGR